MTQGGRRPARSARSDSWPARVRRLEAEVEGLQRAIRTRGLIEQAKGRLVERLGLDADEAFRYLARRSQDTNVAVADVAAELMGAEAPAGADEAVLQRRVARLRAGIEAAAEPAQLLEAVADVDWLGASAVALFAAEADGALRLLAAKGWPARTMSDWRWVPSIIRTPAAEAVRRGEPLWLDEPAGLTVVGPGPHRAALPVVVGSTAVAALEVAFTAEVQFTPAVRRHLRAAADAIASWWASAGSEEADVHTGASDRWVESVVDASLTPAMLLSPIWTDEGELCDFRIDFANAAAVTALGVVAAAGRRLLDVAPDLVGSGTFDGWVRSYFDGGDELPAERFRATRVGGRLIVMWHASTAAGEAGGLQATSTRLATERMRAAVERAQTEQLRAAFFPPPWTSRRHGPLVVAARHVAPSGVGSFRGDFYDLSPFGDELTVTVGDVFGSGVPAAQTMVRLRHAARVLAFAGLGPADVLRLTNLDLGADEDPPMASLVLARIEPDGRTARWAQAGHFSPILVRSGRARSLRRPAGGILGLTPETRYAAATVQLEPGDLLVFYTDGVLHRWTGSAAIRRLAAECERAHAGGGAEELLERVLPPQEDEACLVALHWPSEGR